MNEIRQFSPDQMIYKRFGDGPGESLTSRLIGRNDSSTMGAYFAKFDSCSVSWTVLYDELIVALNGTFKQRAMSGTYELKPGEALWIPQNTELLYEGDKALVFMAIAPVDWRSRSENR